MHWHGLALETVLHFVWKTDRRNIWFCPYWRKQSKVLFEQWEYPVLCSSDKALGSAVTLYQENASCHPCVHIQKSFILLWKFHVFKDSAVGCLPGSKESLSFLPWHLELQAAVNHMFMTDNTPIPHWHHIFSTHMTTNTSKMIRMW